MAAFAIAGRGMTPLGAGLAALLAWQVVLALTGFVIPSTNFRAIRYTINQGQTQRREQPKGLGFAD